MRIIFPALIPLVIISFWVFLEAGFSFGFVGTDNNFNYNPMVLEAEIQNNHLETDSELKDPGSQPSVEDRSEAPRRDTDLTSRGSEERRAGIQKAKELTPLTNKTIEVVVQECKKQGVPLHIALALFELESDFNSEALSSAGAVGLGQLMPETAKWMANRRGIEYSYNRLFNPRYNAKLSIQHVSYLYDKYGDWAAALTAYNRGEEALEDYISRHGTSRSDFSAVVFRYSNKYK